MYVIEDRPSVVVCMYSSLYLLIPKLLTSLSSCLFRASLMPQLVKHLPAMQETQVPSLGQENPLEKGMATHSSIIAWRIPGTEEPGGYSPRGRKELATTEQLTPSLPVSPSGTVSVSSTSVNQLLFYEKAHLHHICYATCE